MTTEKETIQTLLDLLNPLHGSLDKQTYDERLQENFDGPRDREYDVTVTAQQERDLTQAVCILESRLAAAPPSPQCDEVDRPTQDQIRLAHEIAEDERKAWMAHRDDEIERLRNAL